MRRLRSRGFPTGRLPIVILAVLSVLLGVGGIVRATVVGSGTVGGFEVDGNQVLNGGSLDWVNAGASNVVVNDDTDDSGFTNGSKELKPGAWQCANGGANPDKGNILRAYVNPRVDANGAFLDLAWIREGVSGTGDVHLNFEFDQKATASPPGPYTAASIPCGITRTANDLLVTYDFPGGSSDPDIQVFKWTPAAAPDSNHDGDWTSLAVSTSQARAAVNSGGPIDDKVVGGTVDTGRFGEASLDLAAILGVGSGTECQSFGQVNVRSRSSGQSITSALQDKLPGANIDLSTCGKVVVKKVDDHGSPLAGAHFGLFDKDPSADPTAKPVQECISVADGTCTFTKVNPGTYWVKELSVPGPYSMSTDVQKITVHFRETVDLTGKPFVNPRDTGWLKINKVIHDENGKVVTGFDPHLLDGATFVVYPDADHNGVKDSGTPAKLWSNGNDATCTITGGTSSCSTGPLATGTYVVEETVVPPHTNAGPPVPVTITKGTQANPTNVDYVNTLSPLNIKLTKSGPDFAHVGDTFHYTFDVTTSGPRLKVALADTTPGGCSTVITGPTGDANANGWLDPGETFVYGCDHTVKAGDADPFHNTAKATGTDDFGRTVEGVASHDVDILHPAVAIDKKVNGGDHATSGAALQVHANDSVNYTVVVTNTSSDTPLTMTALADSVNAAFPGATCDKAVGAVLLPGAKVNCSYPSVITDDVNNVASVTGKDALGLTGDPNGVVSASDQTFVDVIHPAIKVEKSGPPEAHEGGKVTYTFKVTNTGDTPLHDVAVTDDVLGSVGTIANLAQGAANAQTLTKDFTVPVPSGDVTNTATACGLDPLSLKVCGTDDHKLDVLHPAVSIDKKVNGSDHATSGDALKVHAGDVVTYTVDVKNTTPDGTPLTITDLKDSVNAAFPGASCDHPVGTVLAAGAVIHCSYQSTINADVHNVASVTGKDSLGLTGDPAGVVSASDGTFVDVINPGIEVQKSGPAQAHEGDKVTYSFKVTNTGDVDLHDVNVTDDVLGSIGTIANLGQGAANAQTLTKDFTVPKPSGDVTNTATACGLDPLAKQYCDTDTHKLTVIHPQIQVEKSGPALAHEGDTVTYSFKVTNTGDVDLHDVTVTDDKVGNIGTIASLGQGPGNAKTLTKTFKIPAPSTSITNTATACGLDPLSLKVCDDDHHTVTVIHSAIQVDKSGPPQAHEGGKVTYTFKVTNTGDHPLHDVTVTDDVLGTIGAGPIATLDPGPANAVTLTKDFGVPVPSDDVTNTVTACGLDLLNLKVCDTDKHTLDVLHPAITLDKKVNGGDHATSADALQVEKGDTVTYTVDVKNTTPDNTPLTVTELKDSINAAFPGATCDKPVGTVLNGGDTIHCSYTSSVDKDVHNVASVTGKDPLGLTGDPAGVVSASDGTYVDVINPGIQVVKSGPAQAHDNDTVTYTFKVTNTGDVDLHDVTVTDDKIGTIGTISSLGQGAANAQTLTKDFQIPAGTGDFVNTATACGLDPLSKKLCDTDTHTLTRIHPKIQVEKSGPAQAHDNDNVTYTFKVTNVGDTTLNNVTVTDDKLGNVGTIASLAPNASQTLTKDFKVPAGTGEVVNVVTACGTDTLALQVCDTDDHHLPRIHPSIQVVKTGASQAHEGDKVTYSFKVTNIGDVDLHDVTVTDDVLGTIGNVASLKVGASTTLTKDYTVPAGTGDIVNTATACGVDPLSLKVCDTDDHHLPRIHPGIAIKKTANPTSITDSGPVTYTYVVTNTGDTTLTGIVVTDDILGEIGRVDSLAAGASTTLTKTVTVTTSTPPTNVGTACGNDPLNKQVCANDKATISVVLGEHIERPTPTKVLGVQLGRTGVEVAEHIAIGLVILMLGGVAVVSAKRRVVRR